MNKQMPMMNCPNVSTDHIWVTDTFLELLPLYISFPFCFILQPWLLESKYSDEQQNDNVSNKTFINCAAVGDTATRNKLTARCVDICVSIKFHRFYWL